MRHLRLPYFTIFALLALALAAAGCGDDEEPQGAATTAAAPPVQSTASAPQVDGLVIAQATGSVDEEIAKIERQVKKGPAKIVKKIDHAAAAKQSGLELPPTTLLVLGNPKVGTELMRSARTTGIDLPQKLLVFEQDDQVYVAYNDPSYLSMRHGILDRKELIKSGRALGGLALSTSARTTSSPERGLKTGPARESPDDVPGLVVIETDNSVKQTIGALKSAVKQGPPSVVFDVDHRRNAASVDLELDPTEVVAVGNPMAGTPLMQARRTIAIDLPQKFLAWEDEQGQVRLAYNDPGYLAERHGVTDEDERLRMIAKVLADLATAATSG